MGIVAGGRPCVAVYESKRRKGVNTYLPVVMWETVEDGPPIGYVVGDLQDEGLMPASLAMSGWTFQGFELDDSAGLDLDSFGDKWLDVELVTGRRLVGKRNPDADDAAGGDSRYRGIAFTLREPENTSVTVLPEAIVSVAVDWSQEAAAQTSDA